MVRISVDQRRLVFPVVLNSLGYRAVRITPHAVKAKALFTFRNSGLRCSRGFPSAVRFSRGRSLAGRACSSSPQSATVGLLMTRYQQIDLPAISFNTGAFIRALKHQASRTNPTFSIVTGNSLRFVTTTQMRLFCSRVIITRTRNRTRFCQRANAMFRMPKTAPTAASAIVTASFVLQFIEVTDASLHVLSRKTLERQLAQSTGKASGTQIHPVLVSATSRVAFRAGPFLRASFSVSWALDEVPEMVLRV